MAYESISTNMLLPIPGVGATAGPQYATDINDCLTIIDAHDHTSGNGVQITPSGININANFAMNSNNLITIRSARFDSQSSPLALATDLRCIYVSGADLYYNDSSGNQVRLTQSGAVAGTSGSIANLVAPATASYVAVSEKFVWQSDTNVAASLDARDLILRNSSASSYGMTLTAPTLSADKTITLCNPPAATSFVTMDSSGNLAVSPVVAGGLTSSYLATDSVTTIKIVDSNVTTAKIADLNVTTGKINDLAVTTGKINDLAVTTGKINDGAVTPVKKSALNYTQSAALSVSIGGGGNTSIGSISFNPGNRPWFCGLFPYPTAAMSASGDGTVKITRNGTEVMNVPIVGGCFSINPVYFDNSSANVALTFEAVLYSGGGTVSVTNVRLLAYET